MQPQFFRKINYKNCIIFCFPRDYYQLSIVSSSHISYCYKKNLFYCCSLCLCNSTLSWLHKGLFINLFLFDIQIRDSDVYVYAQSWLPSVGDRNQWNNQLLVLFFYNMSLFCLAILRIYWYNIFCCQDIFRQIKKPMKWLPL